MQGAEFVRNACLALDGAHRLFDVCSMLVVSLRILLARKDPVAQAGHSLEQFPRSGVHRDGLIRSALGIADHDEAPDEVEVWPLEPEHLTAPHAREQRAEHHGASHRVLALLDGR